MTPQSSFRRPLRFVLFLALVLPAALSVPTFGTGTEQWTNLAPSNPPPARFNHTMVADTANDRVIMFGGAASCGPLGDVWVLSNASGLNGPASWTQLAPTGGGPDARWGANAIYDAANNRMTVFGGAAGSYCVGVPPLRNDVWVLSNANGLGGTPSWQQLAPIGPAPSARGVSTSVYDSSTNRMIVFGGNRNIGNCFFELNDTWILTSANGLGGTPQWINVATSGGPPIARFEHDAVYDASANQMIVVGGQNSCGGTLYSDAWALVNANGVTGTPTWVPLASAPAVVASHSTVLDATQHRLLTFGGNSLPLTNTVRVMSNTNTTSGQTWTTLAPAGTPPIARYAQNAVFDDLRQVMIMFGGNNGSVMLNDTWVLNLAAATTLTMPAATGTYGGTATLQATLLANGVPVVGATVNFTLSSAGVGSAATDANGVATLSNVSIAGRNAGLDPGVVSAAFAGNTNYQPSSTAADLVVDRAPVSIAVTGGGTFPYDGQPHGASGTVTGVAAEDLGAATIAYEDLSNASLSAVAPVNVGSYRVNASFAGNANYLDGANNSNTIVITDSTPPVSTATPSPGANAAGWNNTNVAVTLNATDPGGSGVQSITYSLAGQQSGGATVSGSTAVVPLLFAEGITTITYFATDNNGNVESGKALSVRIDKGLPLLSYPSSITTPATSSAGATVNFSVSGSDLLSGLSGPVTVGPLASGATFPAGTTQETVTATDLAGNTAVATFNVVVSPARPNIFVSGGTFTQDGNPHPATAMATDQSSNPIAGTFSFSYLPGGSAPVAAGRYSATASFTSNDPAFTNATAWTTQAPDPNKKVSPAVAEVNGRLYVQGFDQDAVGNQGSFVPRLSIYDTFSNTWSLGASPGIIRAFASAATINGKVYVVGGCVMSDCSFTTGALEIYDPVLNSWSTGASMPTSRFGMAAGVIGGKLYVTGGTFPFYNSTSVTEIYDPATNTWTTGAAIPVSRELAMSAVINGELYVMGGYQRGGVNAPVNRVDVYNPATGWSTRAPMGTARSGAAAGAINGRIHVAGGSGSGYLSATETYDPSSNSWTPQAPMSVARTYLSGAVANGRLYAIDGSNGAQVNANEAFDPALTAVITINPETTPPVSTATPSPGANAAGWNKTNVTVTLNATDNAGGSGVQSITYSLNGQQSGGATVPGNMTAVPIFADGTTTISYFATDNNGNVENVKALSIRIDKGQPLLSYPFSIIIPATSSAGATATFFVSASDSLSGLASPVTVGPLQSGATFPIGTTVQTVTATDLAGNTAAGTFNVVVNQGRPNIFVSGGTFTADGNPHPATATARDQANNPIAGTFTFSYLPGGSAPVAPGRYSATASFTSNDPAFTNATAWTTLAPDPNKKVSPSVAEINGRLYVQGFDQDGVNQSSFVPRLSIYDTFSNTWTIGASPAIIRAYASAVALNGKVYVVGGCVMSDCSFTTGALEIYDPVLNTWSNGAPMPTSRFGMAAGAIGGKLYVAGGTFPFYNSTSVTEIYDPATNTWTTGPSIPVSRELAMAVVNNGELYVIGGYQRGAVNAAVGRVDVFNPATGWSTRSPMPTARSGAAAGAANGRIHVAGGDGGGFLAVTETYDPNTDSWTQQAPMSGARTYLSGAIANGRLYVIDGFNGAQQNTNEVFDPSMTTVITINPGDTTPPVTSANYQAPNANGWNRFNVSVNLNANDPCCATPSSGVQSITYALTGAQTGGGTFNTQSLSFNISNEGTTTVTYFATDNRGNVEAVKSFVVQLDKTQPTAANLSNMTVSATSAAGAVVNFDLAPADFLSGIDSVTRTQGLASGSVFPHGSTFENFTITDKAGNSTFRSFSVTVNKTLLSITVSPSSASVEVGGNQFFTATGQFTSGPDQILPTSGGGGGGGGGGTFVPAGATWQLHFDPLLNTNACPGGTGFSSQGVSPNASGVVNTTWGNPALVQVGGTVMSPSSPAPQVNLTLACSQGGATGSIVASWTGTRFEGTATLGGSSASVSIVGWSSKASLPSARYAFGAAAVNGIVYAMGGGNPGQPQTVDAYNPATGAWTTVSQMPTSREGAGVAALNGTIYVAGGHVAGGAASGVFESYNPATNTWATLPSLPTARAHFAFVTAGGKLYAIGGDTLASNMGLSAVVESYDPSTNAWTTRAPLWAGRNFIVGGALDSGAMIVIAGQAIGGSSTEVYNVASNSWSTGPAMLSPAGGMAAAVVNNALFVFGGFSANGGLTLAHMFRPAATTPQGTQPAGWAAMAAMPTGRGELAVAAVGDVIYAMGGQANNSPLATVEAFHTPPPFDFLVQSGGGGGGGSSTPTVQWQSTNSLVAGINSSGSATGNAPGQTTIVATAQVNGSTVSCATTNTCGLLTVSEPAVITLTLAPGSAVFPSVQVTIQVGSDTEGPFDVPFNQPNDVEPGTYHLTFTPPAGYTVSPTDVIVDVQAGENEIVSLFFAPLDAAPPILTVPSNQTVEASSSSGAVVTFAPATATDAGSGVQSVSCNRSSGETFAIGVSTVSCSATDNAGNTANASFTVTVRDTTPPVLALPANITTDPTSASGSAVSFVALAVDSVDGVRPVTCTPPSGAAFVIGTTTVNCTSADTRGNTSLGNFTVTVRSATQVVTDLVALAAIDSFQQGANLLQNVLKSINAGNTSSACGQLSAFINQVNAQTGKKLTAAEAAALISAATTAKAAIGCP